MTENKRRRLRVKHALELAGLSFSEIARRLGVSRQHVREVASGARVSGRVRRAVVEALGGQDPWADQSTDSAA